MKYKYVEAYQVQGLVAPTNRINFIEENGFSVYIVGNPDEALIQIDRRSAISYCLLKATFGDTPLESLEDEIRLQLIEIKSEREKNRLGGYLIIEIIDELQEYKPGVEQQHQGIHIAFDAIDKEEIRSSFLQKIKNVITALSLVNTQIKGLTKIADGVLLYKRDNSIIFPFSIKGGFASAYVSSPLKEESVNKVILLFNQLEKFKELNKITELLFSSLNSNTDSLRAFLFSWTALEIFVNKVFKIFEEKLFEDIKLGDHPKTRSKCLEKIREVMKNKYNLVDKFSVIALGLSSHHVDSDVDVFSYIKKQRDKFAHGEIISDAQLNVGSTQELLFKYLQLYLTNSM